MRSLSQGAVVVVALLVAFQGAQAQRSSDPGAYQFSLMTGIGRFNPTSTLPTESRRKGEAISTAWSPTSA